MHKLSEYINSNLDIRQEWALVHGTTMPESKFFCPFHDNHNTPSAKRYGNGIKCFGKCQRYYTVYDFLKKFNPDRIEEIKNTVILEAPKVSNFSRIKLVPIDKTKTIKENLELIICQQ